MTNHFESYSEFSLALRLARKCAARIRESYADDVARSAEDGHRAHYCIHGTNQWTDYDNICGGCEGGVSVESMATSYAHTAVLRYRERLAFYIQWQTLRAPGWEEETSGRIAWVMEPISEAL